ncbi:amidohydrolase [Alkalihalobacillus sp. TS-13]|uniref:amidohydrolase n=1 Tax=Alkalihalobacillus sp. TS-13 TaxID=2842455 RepID=UPI001C880AAC|nr:amidohydrolase [Alkalihalobacillus sp. TS-13]
MENADLIFLNGKVLTMDDAFPTADAVTVKNGVIQYVGDDPSALSFANEDTEVIDLNGKTLMPGFIESHIHPAIFGLTLLEVDCKPPTTPSILHLLEKIDAQAAKTPKGEWIKGWGWDDSKLAEKRNPTRWELDEIAPDHPVLLKRACAHMTVVNTKALEMSGITEDTPNPPDGNIERDENGRLTGLLQEKAQGLLADPKYELPDMIKGMNLAQKQFAQFGITTVHDMSTQTTDLRLYQYLLEKDALKVRVRPWIWAIDQNGFDGSMEEVLKVGLRSGFGNDMVKIQGLKFMLDGSVGGKTAAVTEPFLGTKETGILYNDTDEIFPLMKEGIESGLRIAIHAIGDRAIEVALSAFEKIKETNEVTGMRNRIEHCALPTRNHLSRMKKLELIAASSVGFLFHIGDNYLLKLGKERMKDVFPHKSFKEFGIVAPGNSDLPVTDVNPWMGIYGAVTRKSSSGQMLDESQNISVWDALKAYTTDAAYSSFEEETIGVIKPKAKADLMVISDDPLQVDVEKLKDIKVEKTFLEGRMIYESTHYQVLERRM